MGRCSRAQRWGLMRQTSSRSEKWWSEEKRMPPFEMESIARTGGSPRAVRISGMGILPMRDFPNTGRNACSLDISHGQDAHATATGFHHQNAGAPSGVRDWVPGEKTSGRGAGQENPRNEKPLFRFQKRGLKFFGFVPGLCPHGRRTPTPHDKQPNRSRTDQQLHDHRRWLRNGNRVVGVGHHQLRVGSAPR